MLEARRPSQARCLTSDTRVALRTAKRLQWIVKSPMEKTAREIATRLRESGHIAYFAGGCVRDIVRGQAPKDFDIATDAKPEVVQKLFPRTYAVGAHFGVILVVENGFQFEVATFRSDEAYIDGRHPSAVRFSSPEEDAKRRDFTIHCSRFAVRSATRVSEVRHLA